MSCGLTIIDSLKETKKVFLRTRGSNKRTNKNSSPSLSALNFAPNFKNSGMNKTKYILSGYKHRMEKNLDL